MYCSELIILALRICCFSIFLHAAFGDHFIEHTCFGPEFSSKGSYEVSLKDLLKELSAPATKFTKGMKGIRIGSNYEIVYGIRQCWLPLTRGTCRICVSAAIKELRTRCPYSQEAIIWYDNCLLKYSNKRFFGKLDDTNGIFVKSAEFIYGTDRLLFDQKLHELFTNLIFETCVTQLFNARGFMGSGLSKRKDSLLYGVAQCTGDLSRRSCKNCLNVALSELKEETNGRKGGRVSYGSCYLRFELYRFFR